MVVLQLPSAIPIPVDLSAAVQTRAVELRMGLVRVMLDNVRYGLLLEGAPTRQAVARFRWVWSFEKALVNGIRRFVSLMLRRGWQRVLAILVGVLVRKAAVHGASSLRNGTALLIELRDRMK